MGVQYFKDDKLMEGIATVYDPRFHLNYVENKEKVKKMTLLYLLDVYKHDANISDNNIEDKKKM